MPTSAARPSSLERWKPRAARRTQLLLAGTLWSCVGAALLVAGARWTLRGAGAPAGALLIALGTAAGLLKGWFVLDRVAARVADRIAARGDGRCAGGFLSLRSWLLVALMSAAGRLLRGGLVPPVAVGTLYVAIGTGLLFSSRIAWLRWRSAGTAPDPRVRADPSEQQASQPREAAWFRSRRPARNRSRNA
ncbi:MAG TPA: hypothetical protein VN317_00595 [Candidatus Methanoperedens sp.]|nr:hypothetical protein [Candidatus Methanoperedens sp.]